jgi:transcriptional regulator with XRE-family HTH domain
VNRLKYERVLGRLSQTSLGIAARVDQSAIAQMELGSYYPGRQVLERLAVVLGVPADELLKTVSINGEPIRRRARDAAGRYVKATR